MIGALVEVLGRDLDRPAVHPGPGRPWVNRGDLLEAAAAVQEPLERLGLDPADGRHVWVAGRDAYRHLVGVLGSLGATSCAVLEPDEPAGDYDGTAAPEPPAAVVTDDAGTAVAAWARARGIPVVIVADRAPIRPARPGSSLRFFSSGTTGSPHCVPVGPAQLLAALHGVAARLELGPDDTSLGVAPLTHVLGLVTTVLAALLAGGRVALGDLTQPGPLAGLIAATRPTWCTASPSALRMLQYAVQRDRLAWPTLRFLRATSAPLPNDQAAELESAFAVPVIQSYAMTEAPGEIASEGLLPGDRCLGSVGRPTICDVAVRSEDDEDGVGQVWVRGPNVMACLLERSPAADGGEPWCATGDLGRLDGDGFLHLTGRANDVINQGGLKIAPAEVEAAALGLPGVGAAVAFAMPHEKLGQAVGLAVVPSEGAVLDRATLRRELAPRLARRKLPAAIVICDRIPLSRRGKIVRRTLYRDLRLG